MTYGETLGVEGVIAVGNTHEQVGVEIVFATDGAHEIALGYFNLLLTLTLVGRCRTAVGQLARPAVPLSILARRQTVEQTLGHARLCMSDLIGKSHQPFKRVKARPVVVGDKVAWVQRNTVSRGV